MLVSESTDFSFYVITSLLNLLAILSVPSSGSFFKRKILNGLYGASIWPSKIQVRCLKRLALQLAIAFNIKGMLLKYILEQILISPSS